MEPNINKARWLGAAVAIAAGVGMTGALAQCGPRRANPCAPRAANPCAPKAANPCAPKAANPCAPRANPCAPAKAVKLTNAQATKLYQGLKAGLSRGYAKSGVAVARQYQNWRRYNVAPYPSETHGNRFVNNYANDIARDYGKYERDLVLPVGSILAKDSMMVQSAGKAAAGPLFLMEKMPAGFNAESADWKYTLIGPDGSVMGVTKGPGNENVTFCAACHQAAGKSQAFFMPEQFRVKR